MTKKSPKTSRAAKNVAVCPDGTEIDLNAPGGKEQFEKVLREVAESKGAPKARDDDDVAALLFPLCFRPHLCAKKKTAKEKLADAHGVSFRRQGDDCIVEASNGVVSIAIELSGEGPKCPKGRVVLPPRAMRIMARSEDSEIEEAAIKFLGSRVRIEIGQESHTFRVLQPDLPFPGENLLAAVPSASGRLDRPQLDTTQLSKLQSALGQVSVKLRQLRKGVLAVLPGETTLVPAIGFLSLYSDESAAARKED